MATVPRPEPQARADIPRDVPFELTGRSFRPHRQSGASAARSPVFSMGRKTLRKDGEKQAHGWEGATLNRAIIKALPTGWSLWPESTIVLNERSAPLPDFSIESR